MAKTKFCKCGLPKGHGGECPPKGKERSQRRAKFFADRREQHRIEAELLASQTAEAATT